MNSRQRKYIFTRTLSRGVPGHVGSFFEDLARQLIPGAEDCEPDVADFAHWKLDAGFEVKASDNNHQFEIPAWQLRKHIAASGGFPFGEYAYCLFKYRNREARAINGKRRSLLSKCKTREEIRFVLAQGPITLHIFDISILEAMLNTFGSVSSTKENGDPVLEVRHGVLPTGATAGSFLHDIGIPTKVMKVETHECMLPFRDGVLTYNLFVSIVQILPKKLGRKVSNIILPLVRPSYDFAMTAG